MAENKGADIYVKPVNFQSSVNFVRISTNIGDDLLFPWNFNLNYEFNVLLKHLRVASLKLFLQMNILGIVMYIHVHTVHVYTK